jgi:hypothetical protein
VHALLVMSQHDYDLLSEQPQLAGAREELDASLKLGPGSGRSALTRVIVPVAVGAAVLGGIVATLLLSRLLRRQVVLVQVTVPSHHESSPQPSRARAALGSVVGASARAMLPHLAQLLAHKAAERVSQHLQNAATERDSIPFSSRNRNGIN